MPLPNAAIREPSRHSARLRLSKVDGNALRCAPGADPGGVRGGLSRVERRFLCNCRQSERRGAAGKSRKVSAPFTGFVWAPGRLFFSCFSRLYFCRSERQLLHLHHPLLVHFTATREQKETTYSCKESLISIQSSRVSIKSRQKSWFLTARFTAAFPCRGCAKTHSYIWSFSSLQSVYIMTSLEGSGFV